MTTDVDISPEAVAEMVERLWEYGTVIGKAPSTQDAACHDAARMLEALASSLTASERRYRHVVQVLRNKNICWASLMTDAEIDAQVDEDIFKGGV